VRSSLGRDRRDLGGLIGMMVFRWVLELGGPGAIAERQLPKFPTSTALLTN
jgi:hypothetical protein